MTTPEHFLPLTKVSVNMIRQAMDCLELTAELTGDSRTDIINRAVQLYAFAEQLRLDGGRLLVESPGGDVFALGNVTVG